MLCFTNKKFDEALNIISLLDIPYQGLKIHLRYQKAMCLYETNSYEMFLNEYDNLKHFLKNNKFISGDQKSILNNYFNFIDKLFKLKEDFYEIEFSILKEDISKVFKNSNIWFNQKIEEIEKTYSAKLKVKS